jgi:hypothetical protein
MRCGLSKKKNIINKEQSTWHGSYQNIQTLQVVEETEHDASTLLICVATGMEHFSFSVMLMVNSHNNSNSVSSIALPVISAWKKY